MPSPTRHAPDSLAGPIYALAAYLSWGLVVLYWKALGRIPAAEMLAHRVLWSVPLLALLVTLARGWTEVRGVLRQWPRVRYLLLSTVLIAANWGLFISAVVNGRVLQASLGYFINPLVNVLLGVVLLGERLRRAQGIAVAIATCAVAILAIATRTAPWVSLALAGTFGAYGLLRKVAPVGALTGLFLETSFVAPFALAYIAMREHAGVGALALGSTAHDALLLSAGIVTALPLLWFASAARRMKLSTLGFFQYVSPTCQFVLAVAVYGEPLTRAHLVTFALIWSALALFSVDAWRARPR